MNNFAKYGIIALLVFALNGCDEGDCMATIGEEVISELVDTNVTDDTQEYYDSALTVVAQHSHTSFVIIDGTLWATGKNTYGQLGLGDNSDRNSYESTGITEVKSVISGRNHTFILKTDGSVWATGRNNLGQLGFSDNIDRNVFTDTKIEEIKKISCGFDHTFIIKIDGTLWATGYNAQGQLGLNDNSDRNVFTNTSIAKVKKVTCGDNHTAIVDEAGALWMTGYNINGQLGLGDNVNKKVFTNTGIENIKIIACGNKHSAIIKTDKTLWTTGDNLNGQLGLNDNTDRNVFTDTTVSSVENIACGGSHSAIIKTDNSLWATGFNSNGQLGLGDTASRNVFTSTGISNAENIFCGNNHTVLEKEDNIVYSTGFNNSGQLGLGDNSDRDIFTSTSVTPDEYISTDTQYYQNDIVRILNYRYSVSLLGSTIPSTFVALTQIGVVNELKPFDGQNITPAISSSPMTYKITGTEEFNAFTLAKVLATSITYKFRLSDTTLIKEETIAIDCQRDENGTLSLYPTTVIYYADQQMPSGSTVEISIANTTGDVELGDFILNNTIDAGFTNLAFSHGIKDFNNYTPDAWGNIPEAVKAIVTTFNVSMDFPLTNYDYAVSFNESIGGKNITIDASDSDGAVADGETIFGSLTRRVRVTNVSSNSVVKDGGLATMASLKLSVQEIA